MKYECRKCGELKEAYLFTPGEIKKKHLALCRECVRLNSGSVNYGTSKAAAEVAKKSALPLLTFEKYFNQSFYAKKIVQSAEVKALVEARRKRLEGGA